MVAAWLGGLFGAPLTLADLPLPATAQEIRDVDSAARTPLDATLHKVAPAGTAIGAVRYFRLGQPLGYQPVVKQIDNLALARKATRLDLPARRPGYDLVDAWRTRAGEGIAVVMEHGKSSHPLVAYYALKLPRR